MSLGLLGKKIGMTQIFSDDKRIAVTAIEAGPCFVLGQNDKKISLGFDPIKESKLKKPILGFFNKIKVKPLRFIREFSKDEKSDYKVGQELKADIFASGDFVDITGTSIGKGFQGGVKRWHWRGGPKSHGSMTHRRPGSIGSSSDPSRVFKGHHLPGHMGNQRTTIQNLKVVKVDADNNVLLVKGAVPGHRNSLLAINFAKKKRRVLGTEAKTEHKEEIKKQDKEQVKAKPAAKKEEAKKEVRAKPAAKK